MQTGRRSSPDPSHVERTGGAAGTQFLFFAHCAGAHVSASGTRPGWEEGASSASLADSPRVRLRWRVRQHATTHDRSGSLGRNTFPGTTFPGTTFPGTCERRRRRARLPIAMQSPIETVSWCRFGLTAWEHVRFVTSGAWPAAPSFLNLTRLMPVFHKGRQYRWRKRPKNPNSPSVATSSRLE